MEEGRGVAPFEGGGVYLVWERTNRKGGDNAMPRRLLPPLSFFRWPSRSLCLAHKRDRSVNPLCGGWPFELGS